jgi:hypothetical protein
MLRNLTAKQFADWERYAHLEPFSEVRADYRAASIVQILANIHRGEKQKAYPLDDFVLNFGDVEPPKKQTWQEQKTLLRIIEAAYAKPAKG